MRMPTFRSSASCKTSTAISHTDLKSKRGGFTLIELLIAMAILAVLSAVAVPIYTSYSQSTYRGEAMSDLLLCAQGLERFASENFTYVGGDDGAGGVGANVCNPLSTDRYDLSVVTARDSFTLTATPRVGVMDGDGELEFGSNGQRRWNRDGTAWQDHWRS